jgi:hypothetical protein
VEFYGTPQECIRTSMFFVEATSFSVCYGVA